MDNMLDPEKRYCDFCGRYEDIIPEPVTGTVKLSLDADYLWVCWECAQKLSILPAQQEPANPEAVLIPLVGQSAGAICRTLALPYRPPYKTVIDAASTIAYDCDYYIVESLFMSQ
jgi:hypothetical protein